MSLLPRWVHRWYALLGGYFWLPCPLCHRHTGGHEWKDRRGLSSKISVPGSGVGRRATGICPACTRDGLGDPSWAVPR